ncbi:LCP family protein [Macrococcoides canis]|uniref:LCP family glycopolymer transferase n=1 Tax=Macrococcoides canis TaxID=1855823 RepID=UPI0010FBDC5D|nr:LCP family protein [Macrococcus canis]MCO4096809.1 LCP family protein [Macrococcus canis]QCT75617.1 LytR family transcriptional regulator [Macrococcus canis]QNR08787.1 LytR family transcriptional regulator [Macrococcus canis]UTH06662.1 LCP family protein [Macrococcus canis]UTH09012.1 LCP family protein [Macrococcus canis]
MEKKRKKKRFGCLTIFLLLFVVMLFVAAWFIGGSYFKVKQTAENIQHKIEGRAKSQLRGDKVNIANKDAISVALFGVDSNKQRLATGDAGRSDSIILMSINPKTNQSQMLSIPRDTYSEMVGKGTNEKIAHAYAYGGAKMAVASVEKFMNVPIDYYATINMDGMHEMVDKVGGIDVVSNSTFSYGGINFVKGQEIHLDGDGAMAFIRSRKQEGAGGDFGRQERQQLVIQALATKVLSVDSLTKLDSLLKSVEGNVVTDLSFDELKGLATGYNGAVRNVKKVQLQGDGAILEDGLWYFLPNESLKADVREQYMKNLGL